MATIKFLTDTLGSLSQPSKMPGFAWGFSASECVLGAILRKQGKETVCGGCYAHKGMYVFPSVKNAHRKRLDAWRALSPGGSWVELMAELIQKKYRKRTGADRVFRWLDSGDLQSARMLEDFAAIAKKLPDITFWVPTRETGFYREFLSKNECPPNLRVRVSANKVGQPAPSGFDHTSTVDGPGLPCPAQSQGNECGSCRSCWDSEVETVSYARH